MWKSSGGIQGGTVYRSTDEFSFHAQGDKVEVHDIHAMVLKTLRGDHTKLTYRHQGRDFRPTYAVGKVLNEMSL